MSTDQHRCTECGWKHGAPKAHRAVTTLARAVAFTAVEIVDALALSGWVSIALWVIAGWNVLVTCLIVIGLAQLATENPETDR